VYCIRTPNSNSRQGSVARIRGKATPKNGQLGDGEFRIAFPYPLPRTILRSMLGRVGGELRPDLVAVAVGMFADPDFEKPVARSGREGGAPGLSRSVSSNSNIRTEGRTRVVATKVAISR
jgi:hypothetical protein